MMFVVDGTLIFNCLTVLVCLCRRIVHFMLLYVDLLLVYFKGKRERSREQCLIFWLNSPKAATTRAGPGLR